MADAGSSRAPAAAALGRRLAVRGAPAALLMAVVLAGAGLPVAPRAEAPVAAPAGSALDYRAADPTSAEVTAQNLLENERFWPYQVTMVRAPAATSGRKGPPVGPKGVLVRVESGGTARIDFGRDGVHVVPVGDTDIVTRANRIRTGEIEKIGPNFVVALGPRLIDPRTGTPQSLRNVAGYERFLCVIADADSKSLPEIARALAPLNSREGTLTIFVPLGRPDDERLRQRLAGLEWPVSQVFGWIAEPYAASLLSNGVRAPAVQVQTDEGRLLYEGAWSADSAGGIEAALAPDAARVSQTAAAGPGAR